MSCDNTSVTHVAVHSGMHTQRTPQRMSTTHPVFYPPRPFYTPKKQQQFCNHQEQLRQASERLGGVAVEQGTPVRVARDNVVMLPHERPAASFLVVRALGLLAESLRSRGVGGVEDVGDMQAMALACARNAGMWWCGTLCLCEKVLCVY